MATAKTPKAKKSEVKAPAKKQLTPKPQKEKTRKINLGRVDVSAQDLAGLLEGKVTVPNIGMMGPNLVDRFMEQVDPTSAFRELLTEKVTDLLISFNEERSQYRIESVELNAWLENSYDDHSLVFALAANTVKGTPDMPKLTGAIAQEILEKAFGTFHIGIDQTQGVKYFQKTVISYEADDDCATVNITAAPSASIGHLYMSVVYNICEVLKMYSGTDELYTEHKTITVGRWEEVMSETLKAHKVRK